MEADDLSLVELARTGDVGAFEALVVRYQRKVYAVALGIVKDADLAWDVAQEAFVRVHQHLGEFKGDSAFSTWVYRIGSHLAIDAVRKERRSQRDDLEQLHEVDLGDSADGILSTALGQDPRENALRRELAGQLEQALATLPVIHREILVLREVEGLSYEELAARLGIQKGTVMSRLFHARRKMQLALAAYAGSKVGDGGED
jgi:RNA polymerase sigma-70 factor (ECF subfamily)